jgi:CheY-like chemotaxis protein
MSREQTAVEVVATERVINILLIEDSHDDALFFRLALRKSQATVIHVNGVEEAIAHLTSKPLPDLIVLDLVLPGMSVNTFLDWIRANRDVQMVPVVIHTGAIRVPQEVKSAVRKTFFKSGDLMETRLTVSEIVGLAEARSGLRLLTHHPSACSHRQVSVSRNGEPNSKPPW